MSELAAPRQGLDVLFSTSQRKDLRKSRHQKPYTGNALKPPGPPISRRTFLKVAAILGGGGTLVALGIKSKLDEQQVVQDPYAGWEKYQNKILPKERVLRIGEDIQRSSYPGFSKVGTVILESQNNITSFDQFHPRLTQPINIILSNLVKSDHALAMFNTEVHAKAVQAQVRDKLTRTTEEKTLADPDKINAAKIELENSIYLGSSMARRMLLVKEFSHLLYMNDLKDIIFNEATTNKDINVSTNTPLKEVLLVSSFHFGSPSNPSGFGYHYDKGLTLLDYAGYWHIMPAMGKAMQEGALTNKDLEVMSSDVNAFNEAKRRGLLIEQGKGNYVWKGGVGPFSKEWIDVMDKVFV